MIPCAFALSGEYKSLKMPVVIIAGEQDRIVDIDRQSARLHGEVKQSKFLRVAGTGHMVHQTATARVMAAIDEPGRLRSVGAAQTSALVGAEPRFATAP